MTDTAPQDLIRYDVLVQEALRGVVRKVLQEVVKTGLPGQHHFYISFDPRHPGVRLSTRMRQRYPEEMTIVLQHQFWDLAVTEHALEVGLSFGGVPERLLVPFTAIKGFFDPSVQFGLQFETGSEANDDAAEDEAPAPAVVPARPGPKAVETLPAPVVAEKPARPASEKPARPAAAKAEKRPEPVPAPAPAEAQTEIPEASGAEAKDDAAGATVISMDSFRKKS